MIRNVAFALLAALLFTVLLTLWRALARPLRHPRRASCSVCRYEISELPSTVCPECGNAYIDTGISTPRGLAALRGDASLAMLAVTTLVGAAWFASTALLPDALGVRYGKHLLWRGTLVADNHLVHDGAVTRAVSRQVTWDVVHLLDQDDRIVLGTERVEVFEFEQVPASTPDDVVSLMSAPDVSNSLETREPIFGQTFLSSPEGPILFLRSTSTFESSLAPRQLAELVAADHPDGVILRYPVLVARLDIDPLTDSVTVRDTGGRIIRTGASLDEVVLIACGDDEPPGRRMEFMRMLLGSPRAEFPDVGLPGNLRGGVSFRPSLPPLLGMMPHTWVRLATTLVALPTLALLLLLVCRGRRRVLA